MRWLIVVEVALADRAVVRDSGADLAHPVRRRLQRAGLRAPAAQRPGVRHDRALPRSATRPCSSSTALGAVVHRGGAPGPGDARAGGGVCAWVIVEIAFSLHGWPGLGRYMFEPAGVLVVLAGVGDRSAAGRAAADLAGRGLGGDRARRGDRARARTAGGVASARSEHRDIRDQRMRTAEIGKLTGVISRLGGPARLKPCGEPLTRLEYQTILAWNLHVNVATVGYKYEPAIAQRAPDRAVHAGVDRAAGGCRRCTSGCPGVCRCRGRGLRAPGVGRGERRAPGVGRAPDLRNTTISTYRLDRAVSCTIIARHTARSRTAASDDVLCRLDGVLGPLRGVPGTGLARPDGTRSSRGPGGPGRPRRSS